MIRCPNRPAGRGTSRRQQFILNAQPGGANVWCTASTLLPSGSRTNAPKQPSWYSGQTRGSCRTSAPPVTAASKNACRDNPAAA